MKKVSFSNICACASLFISLVLICLWYSNVKGFTVVTLETFVGVIVALLAIIVTLAIIWQIYNVIEIKNNVKELKQLEGKLNEQGKSLQQFRLKTENHIYKLVAWEFYKDKTYLKSINYYLSAVEASIQMEDSDDINLLLESVAIISKKSIKVSDIDSKVLEEIKKTDKHIKSLPNYHFIKDQYEPIYNEFLSKVEKA